MGILSVVDGLAVGALAEVVPVALGNTHNHRIRVRHDGRLAGCGITFHESADVRERLLERA